MALPIENKVEEQLGEEKMAKIDTATFRKICREYATKQLDGQREGFKRLGVRGRVDNPYLTYLPEYEAGNIEIFKKLYLDGSVYRGRKPIHWCSHCHTALAEAEIEYSNEVSPAIFVRFEMTTTPAGLESYERKMDVAIWTTTPWTLPADQCVILHPAAEYVAIVVDGRATIVARDLVEKCCERFGWNNELACCADGSEWSMTGADLAGNEYKQPIFADQGEIGKFIYADYVTLEDGTGIVHGAPGHGVDDYNAGMKFDIPVVMPVDDDGRFYVGEGIGYGGPLGWNGCQRGQPRDHQVARRKGSPLSFTRISIIVIRTAGAAMNPLFSVQLPNGLFPWTRLVFAKRLLMPSRKTLLGILPGLPIALVLWSPIVLIGASAVSAIGAFRFRYLPVIPAAKPWQPKQRSMR